MKREKRPVVLSLHAIGSANFPRYVIGDCYMRFWTGREWSLNQADALVYEDGNDGCFEMQRLMKLEYSHLPVRHYRAPVYLDLYSDKGWTMAELEDWCVKVAKLLMDPEILGNGSLAGALGLLRIDWSKLEECEG